MNAPQPCGGDTGHGCRKPVQPGRGHHVGKPWWHQSVACQAARRRAQYARLRTQAGLSAPLPATTCQHCGQTYRPHRAALLGSFCGRARCAREYRRRYERVRVRAWIRLAAENPGRMAELLAEEAARIATGATHE